MAPGCSKTKAPCNLEQFMKYTTGYRNTKIPLPGGDYQTKRIPDYGLVQWHNVGDGDDLQLFTTELDKSGFAGLFENWKLFKNPVGGNFISAMKEAETIALRTIAKLKADGHDITKNERIKKMQLALQAHEDARRCDQARRLNEDFKTFMSKKGLTVAYTEELITRPPVEGYEKVDMDRTIAANKNNPSFWANEQEIVSWIDEQNKVKHGLRHMKALKATINMREHIAQACKPNAEIQHEGI